MRSVLVTHADEPLGRRVVKTLFHDPRIERLVAAGDGPPPRAFDRFLADPGGRMRYARVDLGRHRSVSDFFHSAVLREAAVDTVVHLPLHGAAAGAEDPTPSTWPSPRTAEARLVLHHCLAVLSIRRLVALSSAFVYRLAPGNANRLREEDELDLDPEVPPAFRSWIDCDMLFHAEVGSERLRVALLRVPTVVTSGGGVYLNPALEGRPGPRLRPVGFDPLCALISDKDLAKGVQAAVHSDARGVFNLSGREAVPLSQLARWTGRPALPAPGVALRALAWGAGTLGRAETRTLLDGPHLRYGFTLDTGRAARELGWSPRYRIGLARSGDGRLRLETS